MSVSQAWRLPLVVLCCQCITTPPTITTADTAETGHTSLSTADTAEDPAPYCAPQETAFPHCGCLTFAVSVGSTFGDIGYTLAATSTGGVVLAGRVAGTAVFGAGQSNETTLLVGGGSSPYSDGFVARYDDTGQLQWVRQHSGTDYAEAHAVATDEASGRVAVAGLYLSPLTVEGGGVQHTLPEDVNEGYIASYDIDGVLQWAVYTQSNDTETLTALAFGPSGELYVTGYSEAAQVDLFSTDGSQLRLKDMGPGGYTGETSAFLLRIEADGALTWAQRLIGTGFQELERLAVLSDGNLVVAGHFTTELLLDPGGPNETTLTPSASLFFARYSPDGALLSVQLADGDGTTFVGGLIATNTGFVFAGQTGDNTVWAPGTPQETVTIDRTGTMARFENDDVLQSIYKLSGNALSPKALAINSDGASFALAGMQSSTTATYGLGQPNEVTVDADPENTNASDPVLLIFDEEGLLDCFWHIDGNETFDQAYGVAYDGSGGVWVTGAFQDQLVLAEGRPDEITLHAVDDADIFLARFSLRPPPQDTAETASDTATGTSQTPP